MNLTKSSFIIVGLGAALVAGCSWLPAHKDSPTTGAAVIFVNNTLESNDGRSLTDVWAAASAALQELKIPVSMNNKDLKQARLEGADARNQEVVVQLFQRNRFQTAVEITIGTVADTDNRAEAQDILQKMLARH